MTNFQCLNCGQSSLVRSNFRFTSNGVVFCRRLACEEARQDEEDSFRFRRDEAKSERV